MLGGQPRQLKGSGEQKPAGAASGRQPILRQEGSQAEGVGASGQAGHPIQSPRLAGPCVPRTSSNWAKLTLHQRGDSRGSKDSPATSGASVQPPQGWPLAYFTLGTAPGREPSPGSHGGERARRLAGTRTARLPREAELGNHFFHKKGTAQLHSLPECS